MEIKEFFIALVEDNPEDRKQSRKMLDAVLELECFDDINPVVNEYENGQEILDSKIEYDLAIMDYAMPGVSGIEAAVGLLERGAKTKVLYLSGYDEIIGPLKKSTSLKSTVNFIFKLESVESVQYKIENAIKDILDVEIIEIRYYKEVPNIDTGKNEKEWDDAFIDMKKIVDIEAEEKKITIYMENDKTYLTNEPLHSWLLKLPAGDFHYANKSRLVNFKYVKSFSRGRVILTNEEEISLSRKYKDEFIEKRRGYLLREARK